MQLNWISNELSSGDGHPQLVGFSIWLYEYMSNSDWKTWKSWITTGYADPTPPQTILELLSFFVGSILIAAILAEVIIYKKTLRKVR